jgi:hypothetical protein
MRCGQLYKALEKVPLSVPSSLQSTSHPSMGGHDLLLKGRENQGCPVETSYSYVRLC